MKILVSAYACEPNAGSEPGAGWTWVRAAARHHDVWLLTRRNNRDGIEAARKQDASLSLHPVYFDLPGWAMWWKRGQRGVHTYYLIWQRLARRMGRRLNASIEFDVAHHLTFAVDWMPSGVADIPGLPFVWGPVGGTTGVPKRLWRWLGAKGFVREVAREMITRPMRRCFGDRLARRAAVVVAQNCDVAKRFGKASAIVTEPNVALDISRISQRPPHARVPGRRAVYAGRLIPLKGVRIALAALAESETSEWSLDIYGDGPERKPLQDLVDRLGLDDRVVFHGNRPREEVFQGLMAADAFLFPSLHEGSPWSVGEALALGCPVVCLDHGGAPLLLGEGGGIAVPPTRDVVKNLARALNDVVGREIVGQVWSEERLPAVLDAWYERAARRSPVANVPVGS